MSETQRQPTGWPPKATVCDIQLAQITGLVTGINARLALMTHAEVLAECTALGREISMCPSDMAAHMLMEIYERQEQIKRPRASNDDRAVDVEWLR